MIYIPVICLAVAAVGGLIMVTLHVQKIKLPMPLILAHGIVAATGLVFLIITMINGYSGVLISVVLGLFIVVALGGFTLFSFQIRKKALPDLLIGIHAGAAVIAFVLLLMAVFN